MKKFLFFSLILPVFAFANTPLKDLLGVNKQWANNPDGISFLGDYSTLPNEDGIISHLILVEKVLRARPVSHLTGAQKENRSKYLDILNKYWKIGRVPTNDYAPETFPIFIDRKGVHCAVGYLLQQGGFENIAQTINRQQKFAHVHQIKVSELVQWQKESGLTLDELAWIQPDYPYQGTATELGKGLNGEVMDIKNSSGKYLLIAAGKFKIDGDPNFVVLAGFDGMKWNSIITGAGVINKIDVNGNIITSYGGDITFGMFNKVEILETDISGMQATHKLIGDLDGEISDFETYNNKKYVCGKFTGGMAEWQDPKWVTFSSSKIGNPTSIRVYNGKLFITGTKLSKDQYALVSYDGIGFDDKINLPQQATFLQVFNNKLFIGSKSNNEYYNDTLLYCYDGIRMVVFDSIQFFKGREVKNIVVKDHKMLLTGELRQATGWGIYDYGNGVALYNSKAPDNINPLICVDGYVNSAIFSKDDEFILAGNFTSFYRYNTQGKEYRMPLMGCGTVYENRVPSSTNDLIKTQVWAPFPNPFSGIISFAEAGQLFDINGKLTKKVSMGQNDISDLSAGVYVYVSEKTRVRIVKQ